MMDQTLHLFFSCYFFDFNSSGFCFHCVFKIYIMSSNVKMFTFFEIVVHFPYFRPIYSISELVCTLMTCIFELTLPKSFASSANSFIHDRTTSGRSFINIKNNIGPNTLPCGIPLVTFADFELLPSITTFCDLPVKNSFIQLCTFPWIPYPQSFFNSLWWGTLSKALRKSK